MNLAERQNWLLSLRKAEKIAQTNKLNRFLSIPGRYIFGQLWSKLIYPTTKRIIFKKVMLFFDHPFTIPLPTGLDIFLLGAKTHDSEIRLARFFIRHINQGDTIFDIGAHLGYFTSLTAKLTGGKGRTYAWEASPKMFTHLLHNLNKTENVFPQNAAMSSQVGTASFHEFPIKYSEYNSVDAEQYKGTNWFRSFSPEKVEVSAHTLDSFTYQNMVFPKIIKIDVEGAEEEVLKGASILFAEQKPAIVMEFLRSESEEKKKSPHQKAAEILIQNGYLPFNIESDGLLKPSSTEQFMPLDCDSDNIVFIHPENPVEPCM